MDPSKWRPPAVYLHGRFTAVHHGCKRPPQRRGDDLVISKGYADQRYITSGLPLRVADEPTGKLHYTWTISRYVENTVEILSHYNVEQNLISTGHGLESGSNGLAIKFKAEDTDPTGLVSNTTYYVRVFITKI